MVKIILVALILLSCSHENSTCRFTSQHLLEKYGARIFGTKTADKETIEFRDKGQDSVEGGYYTFYKNGNLKSYQFFVDMTSYIYTEDYDSLGNFIKMDGDPSVRKLAKVIKDDSVSIKLYFFALNKKYRPISVVTSDNRNLFLIPMEDTLYSNTKSISFSYSNLKEEKDLVSYITIEYENLCTKKINSFKDSVVLHYRP